jgi:hypothetical protein
MQNTRGATTWPGTAPPPLSEADSGRIYYDLATNMFMVSQNGGAYAPLGAAGSGWVDLGGSVVLATTADNVGVGISPPSALAKLHVLEETATANSQTILADYLGHPAGAGIQQTIHATNDPDGDPLVAAAEHDLYSATCVGDAASNAGSVVSAFFAEVQRNTAPGFWPTFFIWTDDPVNDQFDATLSVNGMPCIIETLLGPPFTGTAPPIQITPGPSTAGNVGAHVEVTAGQTSGAQAGDVRLAGGEDLTTGLHGTVRCFTQDPGGVALTAQAAAAQTANIQEWQNSVGYVYAQIDLDGNLILDQRVAGAGADSVAFVLVGEGSAGQRNIDDNVLFQAELIYGPPDVLSWDWDGSGDTDEWEIANQGTRQFFGTNLNAVGILAGTGVTATARPGQLTDNTTGAAGAILAAVPAVGGSGATAAQEGAINDNFKRLLDRMNSIEAKLVAFGHYTP